MAAGHKDPGALKTIGELSQELGVAQHILRYWETRFPQLRPMQRAGNRRYYRPADVELAQRINLLLNEQGYTVRGVQKMLRDGNGGGEREAPQTPLSTVPSAATHPLANREPPTPSVDLFRLRALRERLANALEN